jgi:hypothetical protein
MVDDKVCFVICPIGKPDSDIRKRSDLTFHYIIKPVVENFGYCPIRADHINEAGMITHQIIDYIIESPLVVADLTDSNPNVFYELAIRHIVEKPYIQMIKSNQEIPFDVNGMRTIPFDIDLEQADIAKQELTKQIKSIENNDFKATNPYTLSNNYSVVQNILKERKNIQPINITDIVLDSVNGLRSMMDQMREDIHNLRGSSNMDMNDERYKDIFIQKKMLKKYIIAYNNALANENLEEAEDIAKEIDRIEVRLSLKSSDYLTNEEQSIMKNLKKRKQWKLTEIGV